MSVALRKRNHRLEEAPHTSLMDVFVPASMIVLIITILVVVLGHFFPAR
ncbi:MAG TPA: hypothetical protein VMH81_22555 [Bryobacteraceae bacterium]|nr:hypothetical protein [Bryobacteraceae bacterium]